MRLEEPLEDLFEPILEAANDWNASIDSRATRCASLGARMTESLPASMLVTSIKSPMSRFMRAVNRWIDSACRATFTSESPSFASCRNESALSAIPPSSDRKS